jgi:hypothetical protein
MMFFDMHDDLDDADLMASLLLAPESERGALVAELSSRLAEASAQESP